MSVVGDLVVNLIGNVKPLQSALGQARSYLDSFAGTIGTVLAAGHVLSEAGEEIAAQKRLAAVVNATGEAAGFSSSQLVEFASDLQNVTNFADEVTTSAMAVLATFTNIKGDVFKDAVKSAQDLATITGTDLQAAMVQIGKALNNPATGLAGLAKAGVTFTEQQQEQIKALVKSNDLLGAQRIVIDALKGKFGGAAEALASPFKKLQNILSDISEEIGKALLPPLRVLANLVIPFVQEWSAWLTRVGVAMLGVVGVLKMITVVQKSIAIGQALIASLSGPAGWAAMAAGAAVFTGAMIAINSELGAMETQERESIQTSNEFVASLRSIGDASEDVAPKMKKGHTAVEEFHRLLDEAMNPAVKLKTELANIDALAMEIGGHAMALADGVIKPAAIEQATGMKAKLREITDEIRKLSGAATDSQLALEEMARAGASPKALEQLANVQAVRDGLKEQQKSLTEMQRKALGVIRENQSPAEKLATKMKELNELRDAKMIDQATFDKATAKAEADSAKEKNQQAFEVKGAGALQHGSKESLSSIFSSMRGTETSNPQVKLSQQQLKEAQEHNNKLEAMLNRFPGLEVVEI